MIYEYKCKEINKSNKTMMFLMNLKFLWSKFDQLRNWYFILGLFCLFLILELPSWTSNYATFISFKSFKWIIIHNHILFYKFAFSFSLFFQRESSFSFILSLFYWLTRYFLILIIFFLLKSFISDPCFYWTFYWWRTF